MKADAHVGLWVDGEPIPKGRPRHNRGRTFTPARTLAAERVIRDAMYIEHPDLKANDTDRFAVTLTFYIKHRRRRDVDNLAKLVMDALNNVVWEDDSQVVSLHAHIHRAKEPGTLIQVSRIDRDPWAKP